VAQSNNQMAAVYMKMADNEERRLLNDDRRLLNDEKLINLLSTIISKLN